MLQKEPMELALNLVWISVCAGSFAFLRNRILPRPRSPRRHQVLQGLITLGGVLVLILPVISITDDLETQLVPVEEPASVKATKCLASHFYPVSLKIPSVPTSFAFSGFMIPCPRCIRQILPADLILWATRLSPRFENCGPPRC